MAGPVGLSRGYADGADFLGRRFAGRADHEDGKVAQLEPRRIPDFAVKCTELQTSPESSFVKTTVCQRYQGDDMVALRGAVLRTVTEAGLAEPEVTGRDEYQAVLEHRFGIRLIQLSQQPGAQQGFVARTKALMNLPSTSVAIASASMSSAAKNSRASSIL